MPFKNINSLITFLIIILKYYHYFITFIKPKVVVYILFLSDKEININYFITNYSNNWHNGKLIYENEVKYAINSIFVNFKSTLNQTTVNKLKLIAVSLNIFHNI